MFIYHYHFETGAFLGQGEADKNPLDRDNPLIPAFATTLPPLPSVDGNISVFRDGAWGYVREDSIDDDPEPEPLPPTIDDVAEERSRRLALGFDYDFGDSRGVHHIGTTASDMTGWEEVTQLSAARLATGDSMTPIAVVTDTGPVEVTPAEWQQVLLAAADFRQPLWAASFALQAMDPIPADYATNEAYWPA
ncbi:MULTISPECIES: hypothetical protein [unclassified Sinorhizobium]|uniref:hypothetical protein n=1 Tax=unclassified Sinorhizobium TaxID=2613772 RepID=UPI003526A1D9